MIYIYTHIQAHAHTHTHTHHIYVGGKDKDSLEDQTWRVSLVATIPEGHAHTVNVQF